MPNLFFRAGYIESWGRGTIAIAQECKAYGLPAPAFNEQFGGFTIGFYKPESMTPQVAPQVTPPPVTPPVTLQVKQLMTVIAGEMTREELQIALGITNKKYFLINYIKPELEAGLIEMTNPDKPNSKNQKYRLTQNLQRKTGDGHQSSVISPQSS